MSPSPVVLRPSPLRSETRRLEVPEGLTVAQIVEATIPDPVFRRHAHVEIMGTPIPPEAWERVRPIKGAQVNIVILPGGGADGLRIALMVGVAFATIATGGLAAPLIGTFGAGLLATGISIAGTLAINALVPPPQPQLNDATRDSPHYSIEGASNQARRWAKAPILLGRFRIFPPLAAETISRSEGDDVYLSMALLWSQGKVALEQMKIGETPIDRYKEVRVETDVCGPQQSPSFTLYPRDLHQEVVGADLTKADGWVSQRTPPDTTTIQVEIGFPEGLIGYGKKTGDRFGQTVEFEVESKQADTTTWISRGAHSFTGKTSSAIRRSIKFKVSNPGQHDVRVRRISDDPDPNEQQFSRSQWLFLITQSNRNPILAKYVTASAFDILATGQLSGTVDDVNAIGTSICLDWDNVSHTWIERKTRNPASLVRHILQAPFGWKRFRDDQIDMAAFQDWHEYCDDSEFWADLYVDWDARRLEVIDIIAAVGRATVRQIDGLWKPIIDRKQDVPVQYFTPRNSRNFKTRIVLAKKKLHGFRVKFTNADEGYRQDEVIAYADGFNATNATELEELEAPGITSASLAWIWGRYQYAQWKLRPEEYGFETDWSHLSCNRGDLVHLAHDSILVGLAWGRVRSWTTSGGNLATITLDERVAMVPGTFYSLVLHRADGSSATWRIVNNGGIESTVVTLEQTVPASSAPAAGDMAMIGERGIETMPAVVKAIRPGPDLTASITCVPAAWIDEKLPVPPFNARLTSIPGAEIPIIGSVRSDETVAQRDADGSVHLQLVVTLRGEGSRPLSRISAVVMRWRAQGGGGQWRMQSYPPEAIEALLPGVEVGEGYEIQARYAARDGRAWPWSATTLHSVVGPGLAPPDVSALWTDGDRIAWSYDYTKAPDLAGFHARYGYAVGGSWDAAVPLTEGVLTAAEVPFASVPQDAKEILVRAVTTSGVLSLGIARLAVDPTTWKQRVRFHADDLGLKGFPGTIAGGQVQNGALKALDTSIWLAPPKGRWLEPPDGTWLAPTWARLEWQFGFNVPSGVQPTDRIVVERNVQGNVRLWFKWASGAVAHWDDYEPMPNELMQQPLELPLGSYYAGGGGGQSSPWLPWRDGLRPEPGDVLNFLLVGEGGERAVVSELRVVVDAAEVEEVFEDVAIPAAGARLVPTKPFRGVRWVFASVQSPSNAFPYVDDKSLASGPRLHVQLADGTWVAATADVTVGGY